MAGNLPQEHTTLDFKAHRVVWGWREGHALQDELRTTGVRRFLLLASSERAEQRFREISQDTVTDLQGGSFARVVPHVPQASVALVMTEVRRSGADGLVAFGGGSALDTAKAISHDTELPIIAIPTNFSGSEVTWNYGLTVNGVKQTVRNPAVLPRSTIYDGSLVCSLPLPTAICSGVNAVAHAVEALYAPQANPLTQAIAQTGIARMIAGLRAWAASGADERVGAQCLSGAWLCGEALAQVGMGLHHRICHTLGGTYGLPHAAAHTTLLPYLIDWNTGYTPVLHCLNELFDGNSFATSLAEFSVRHGAPASLRDLGLPSDQIANVARLACESPIANPRPVSVDEIEALLWCAYRGDLVKPGQSHSGSI